LKDLPLYSSKFYIFIFYISFSETKLPKEEYEALKRSIQNEGLHFPIIVNPEGYILDGHHRWRICQQLQLLRLQCT